MAIFKEKFRIMPQEVDFTGRQTLPALGSCMLNAASGSAASFGFGLEHLHSRGMSWVLSRLHIEMQHYACMDDEIEIETWPRDCNRLTSARHFHIFGHTGNLLGEATSLWSVIDFETRRPVDMLAKVDLRPFVTEQDVAAAPPARIDELHTEPIATHTVHYSDIDFNAHTNSMKYIQWMLDTLDLAQFDGQHIATLDINYAHEARFGETVNILRAESERGYHFDLKSETGRSFCKAKMAFAPNI